MTDVSPHHPTVLITGLGLMGASLAAAVQSTPWKVLLHHWQPAVAAEAAARGWGTAVTDFSDAAQADVAVICTPVSVIADTARAIAAATRAVITDVGSTKNAVCKELADLGSRFVGSHPMCGSHLQGLAHADPLLYQEKLTLVTPMPNTAPESLALIESLWQSVGSRCLRLTPDQHDRVVAEASHLPHVLASLAASQLSPTAAPAAASGFRDTTRVAAGSPELWRDILLTNRQAMTALLRQSRKRLKELEELLEQQDGTGIIDWLSAGKAGRQRFEEAQARVVDRSDHPPVGIRPS